MAAVSVADPRDGPSRDCLIVAKLQFSLYVHLQTCITTSAHEAPFLTSRRPRRDINSRVPHAGLVEWVIWLGSLFSRTHRYIMYIGYGWHGTPSRSWTNDKPPNNCKLQTFSDAADPWFYLHRQDKIQRICAHVLGHGIHTTGRIPLPLRSSCILGGPSGVHVL